MAPNASYGMTEYEDFLFTLAKKLLYYDQNHNSGGIMNLNDIQKELERKSITFRRLRGRIEVTTVSGKPSLSHAWAEYDTPREYTFAFAVNSGNIFSVIYQANNLCGNDFFLCNDASCDPRKLGEWWRVVNCLKENESVKEFVQRSEDWFEGFRNHLLKMDKEECRRKLVRNILNGNIEEFSKSMKNVKKENDIYHYVASGELNKIPTKIGWHTTNYGEDFIITVGIGKANHRATFTNKWGKRFNFNSFVSKAVKSYESAYSENDTTENDKNHGGIA